MKAQWDAQNIFPQNYKNDLIAFLRTYINDPSHIRGAAVSQPQLKNVGPGDRYIACVRYDARKDGGQYAGPKDGRGDLSCRASSTATSMCPEKCVSFARTRPTGRFPSWKSSRASANDKTCATTAGLDERGGTRFRQKGRK